MEPIVEFIFLLAILFLIPKFFVRYNVPEPLSEIFIGILLGPFVFVIFEKDIIIEIMGTIGIITLFFIAGYEINFESLKKKRKTLQENGIIHALLIFFLGIWVLLFTPYSWSVSFLIAIAFLTPSAGFILSSLKSLNLKDYLNQWIESKVISAEIFTLLLLLIIMNFKNPAFLFGIILGLVALFFFLPYILLFFFKHVIVKSIHADTFFLFLLAIVVAFFTHSIGVHYIIGAFFVGIIVNRFKDSPSHFQINNDKIRDTFLSFSSIFIPFYFFSVGLSIEKNMISFWNIFVAVLLFLFIFTLKIIVGFFHRRLTLNESFKDSVFVSLLTTPTLLFTFVVAELIRPSITDFVYGILIIYALFSAAIPYLAHLLLRYIHKNRFS